MAEVERGVETIIQNFATKVVKPEAAALDCSEKGVLLEESEEALKRVEEEVASAQTRTESTEGALEGQCELGGKLLAPNWKLAMSTAALHGLQSHVK